MYFLATYGTAEAVPLSKTILQPPLNLDGLPDRICDGSGGEAEDIDQLFVGGGVNELLVSAGVECIDGSHVVQSLETGGTAMTIEHLEEVLPEVAVVLFGKEDGQAGF